MPLNVKESLIRFRYKHWATPATLGSVKILIRALREVHERRLWPRPDEDPGVRDLLSVAALHETVPQENGPNPPLRREHLIALLETCDSSLVGIRDRSFLLLAWTTGLRCVKAVENLTVSDLYPSQYGYQWPLSEYEEQFSFRMRSTSIEGIAADALDLWLEKAQISHGPVFFRCEKNRGRFERNSFGAISIAKILRERSLMAGLRETFSFRSIQRGYDLEIGSSLPSISNKLSLAYNRRTSSNSLHLDADIERISGQSTADNLLRDLDDLLVKFS